jgi:hypothetical protein
MLQEKSLITSRPSEQRELQRFGRTSPGVTIG